MISEYDGTTTFSIFDNYTYTGCRCGNYEAAIKDIEILYVDFDGIKKINLHEKRMKSNYPNKVPIKHTSKYIVKCIRNKLPYKFKNENNEKEK